MQSTKTGEILLEAKAYPLIIKNFARAKSIKLRVQDGTVLITKAPHTPDSQALDFAQKNKLWLLEKLQVAQESLEDFLKNIEFLYIEQKAYNIILLKEDKGTSAILNHSKQEILFSYRDNEALGEVFLAFAKKILKEKAKQTALALDIDISKISIRSQRSLWGSRSTSGMLSLNWRIALLPENLQNYIICHELAHIRFMDHSTSFWLYLNTLCPQAKKLDKILGLEAARIFKVLLNLKA